MHLVIFGLALSSSWGNGHATTYRALLQALARRGHRVSFFERDVPWYAAARDLPAPDFCELVYYDDLDGDWQRLRGAVTRADAVIVGSYVPEGQRLIARIAAERPKLFAFYDIDTPVTLAALDAGACDYLQAEQVAGFDLYASFSGGRALERLRRDYGARRTLWLPCGVDPERYRPLPATPWWDLSYLGTYARDRQPALDALLLEPARRLPKRRFAVAGSLYPPDIDWPANVERFEHVPPAEHPRFFARSRFTLNVTRADMVRLGHSPSVRLFEAAACGTAIVTDPWHGLEESFTPGAEVVVAGDTTTVIDLLRDARSIAPALGAAARARALRDHTAARRAHDLEAALTALAGASRLGLPA
jgi:spore maturation protein CgeB